MDAIADPAFAKAFVIEVLAMQRRWSQPTAAQVLASLRISPGVLCGALTDRQRDLLSRWLDADPATRGIIAITEQRRWENAG